MEVRTSGIGGKPLVDLNSVKFSRFNEKPKDLIERMPSENLSIIINNSVKKSRLETDQREESLKERIKDKLDKQVDGLNQILEGSSFTSLKFNVHEKLERLYVQVIDSDTEEVVKEIPPEKFLDMVASMLEHAGLIVDKKI